MFPGAGHNAISTSFLRGNHLVSSFSNVPLAQNGAKVTALILSMFSSIVFSRNLLQYNIFFSGGELV